ncbi:hypothetical protein [uncultured Paraglaciecola sp.]|uniref:hypothetical protein n=1 Tax=uncultured Paraglaciecola sp. TaxID=1765024 RepID=UPI00262EFFED|nr:hypothetical protein [uncultured Paraglaciecola sp.]
MLLAKIKAFSAAVYAQLFHGLPAGLEVFLILTLGHVGHALAKGHEVHQRELIGVSIRNIAVAAGVIGACKMFGLAEGSNLVLASLIGVFGVNAVLAIVKKYTGGA